jgi:hypothetical protein
VTDGTIPPLILTTSIDDSLPAEMIKVLKLEGITGVKVQHYSGTFSSYFEYKADKSILLNAISELPFPMDSNISDTRCRKISFEALTALQKSISTLEVESAPGFWSSGPSQYEIFECIKAPFRHIVQIEAGTRQIRHRIELLEQS